MLTVCALFLTQRIEQNIKVLPSSEDTVNKLFKLFDKGKLDAITQALLSGVAPNGTDHFGRNLQAYNASEMALINLETDEDPEKTRDTLATKQIASAKKLHAMGVTDTKKALKIAQKLGHTRLIEYLQSSK